MFSHTSLLKDPLALLTATVAWDTVHITFLTLNCHLIDVDCLVLVCKVTGEELQGGGGRFNLHGALQLKDDKFPKEDN